MLELKSLGLAVDVTGLDKDDIDAIVNDLLDRCDVQVDQYTHPASGETYITFYVRVPAQIEEKPQGGPFKAVRAEELALREE